jgi:hypothetical protein
MDVVFQGVDPDRIRPLGGGLPRPLQVENLLEVAAREEAAVYLVGQRRRMKDLGHLIRWFDRVEKGDIPGSWEPGPVVDRVLAQFRQMPVFEEEKELWVVSLIGDGGGWPKRTRKLLDSFLERGDSGRSMVCLLGLPGDTPGKRRSQKRGFLLGNLGQGKPEAELQLEDVAPSLLSAMGFPEPAAATGVPRLDLFLPRDVSGACGVLLFAYDFAWERQCALATALGHPLPLRERGFLASERLQEGDPRGAQRDLLEARERLRNTPFRPARQRRRHWNQQGRRVVYWRLYAMMLFAGSVLAAGLLLAWRRHSLTAALAGTLVGLVVDLILWSWFLRDPQGYWVFLCKHPSRRLALGTYTAMVTAVPVLGAGLMGWCRRGGGLASYLIQLFPWLMGLSLYFFQHGPLLADSLARSQDLILGIWICCTILMAPWIFLLAEMGLTVIRWSREHPQEASRAI